MTESELFLGVDGGGSKTQAVVVDAAGHILGTGYSGQANYQTVGLDTAIQHIREAAQQALGGQRAGCAAFCLSGADMPTDFLRLEPALRALDLCDDLTVRNDSMAILRAGSSRPYGVAVVCGSGFNAGGISRDGREFRLPALGAVTGDDGGGYALGEAALGLSFRAWDGRGDPTVLVNMVLDALNAQDMLTLADRLAQHEISWQQILDLAPLIFRAALMGDAVACGVLEKHGREIGISILTILRRLDLLTVPCDVVLGGAVFSGEGPLLLDTIRAVVLPAAPLAAIKRLDVKPVIGAALLALDRAGIDATAALRAHLPGDLKVEPA